MPLGYVMIDAIRLKFQELALCQQARASRAGARPCSNAMSHLTIGRDAATSGPERAPEARHQAPSERDFLRRLPRATRLG